MAKDILNFLKENTLILDGAMGTELFKQGIDPGKSGNYLNITDPEVVINVHESYLNAGCDAVITNTFEANKYSLKRHGLDDKVQQINEEGAKIARKAAGDDKFVIGGFGPTGDFLEPLGTLKPDELKENFKQQAKALVNGGADAFIIETFAAMDEMQIAAHAIRETADLPIICSFAYDANPNGFRTMMGLSPQQAVDQLKDYDIQFIGFNCGKASLEQYQELASKYLEQIKNSGKQFKLSCELNAGIPQIEDGKSVYKVEPDEFAQACKKIADDGAKIIGGCCGTSPAHIQALAKVVK